MTPVVWMINMSDDKGFMMRVEASENGLFILQKISNDGKKIEDIAYYSNRKKAVRALSTMTRKIKGNTVPASKLSIVLSMIQFLLVSGAALGVLYILYTLLVGPASNVENVAVDTAVEQQLPAPVIETDPNAIGVPLSADDFFKQNNKTTGLPF